jgi:hypothetical protein
MRRSAVLISKRETRKTIGMKQKTQRTRDVVGALAMGGKQLVDSKEGAVLQSSVWEHLDTRPGERKRHQAASPRSRGESAPSNSARDSRSRRRKGTMPQAGLAQKFDCLARYMAQEGLSRSGRWSSLGPCVMYELSTFQQAPWRWRSGMGLAELRAAAWPAVAASNVERKSASPMSRRKAQLHNQGPCLPG